MKRPAAWGALLGLILGVLWCLPTQVGLLDRPAWWAYHALFDLRGPQPRSKELAIVELDEASLAELGVWPLPRTVYATLIDELFTAGARLVALDVTFPARQTPATDEGLAAALRRHPGRVVLAANLQALKADLANGQTIVYPIPPLRQAAVVGVVNMDFDTDGGIHTFRPGFGVVDPVEPSRLRDVPSFDMAIADTYCKLGPCPERQELSPWPDGAGPQLINFVGPPADIVTIPLSTVLEAAQTGKTTMLQGVRDRAVLLGATSTRLQDQYPTPFTARALFNAGDAYMAGVAIHANAVSTIMRGNPIIPAPDGVRLFALVVLCVACGALGMSVGPWTGAALLLGLFVLEGAGSFVLFKAWRFWLDPAAPAIALSSTYVATVIEHFRTSERTRRFYRRTFERYVAKDIVDEILANPGLAPRLGGELREVTVLFSDIRSFTTISEERTPEQVVEFLNAYLTAMAEVIHARQGCIDKYIGDAILALWGNVKPLTPAEGAAQGVRAALAMKARVEALRPVWEAQGFPRIDIGVGVNTGHAVVGNIGSPEKLEFGVIGDSINVASRLEGLTKDYGGAIVISGRTRELLGERFECTFLDSVKVKGRVAPVDIYAVERELL